MNDASIAYRDEEIEPPVSVSHIVHILRAYANVIMLSLLGVGLVYSLAALVIYIGSPSQRTLTQPFRLDFPRATEGKYPNGLKFSSAEIISVPVLAKVYAKTQINRFMSSRDFMASIYITESNPEFDQLQREYRARLNDPKLGSVERQQLEREYADKQAGLAKNLYSLNFATLQGTKRVPDEVVYRALSETLSSWADWAQTEGRVTSYDTAVLSPSILDDEPNPNPVVTIRILIKKLAQVLDNIGEIGKLPSASLSRTTDHMSLAEIKIKIEDLIRFRLEPMVPLARATLVANEPYTIRFAQTQLAYDQRKLQSYQDQVDAIRNAIAVYTNQRSVSVEAPTTTPASNGNAKGPGETVMPQLNDTFIDRLAQLLNQSADVQYRQRMVNEMRAVLTDMTPVQEAVRYDQELLHEVMTPAPQAQVNQTDLRIQINQTRDEGKRLVAKANEIYTIISHNLNPETYLYTVTEPPHATILRSITIGRLAVIGLLIILVTLPVVVVFCFIHNRIRQEEHATAAASV